jgi:hypothetical protein
LANPHNPSGVALSHEEVLALALTSEEKGATVLIDEIRRRSRPLVEGNLRIVSGFMWDQEALEWVAPDPGIICFPRLRGARDATDLARRLLEGYDTGIVPGRFFEEPRSFRLGFGIPTDSLVRGLGNLKKAIHQLGLKMP